MKERDKEKEKKEKHRPPALPLKLSNLRGKSFDSLSDRGSLDNISISSDITHSRPSKTGYSDSALLSPNLSTKLKKIPSRSKVNAPLPYVNLEKYDMGDKGSNHVHLPAASSSAPDRGKTWSGGPGQRSKGYDNVKGSDRDSMGREKRISVSLPGSRENLRSIGGSDFHLDLQSRNMYYSNEPIYANEPRSESPPPALPPKGPALLNKLRQKRAAAARAPPRPPPVSPRVLQKLDKLPPPYPGPRTGIHPPPTPPSPQEENYFVMGGPQSIRQEFESQRLQEALAGRTFVKLPPREHKTSISSATEENCYMDMSVCQFDIERSKSFNDANAALDAASQRPKYHRSLSASGVINKPVPEPPKDDFEQSDSAFASAGNSPKGSNKELIREPNYMLMSSVMNPRRSVIEKLQSLQAYVDNTKSEIDDSVCSNDEIKKMLAESVEQESRQVPSCDDSAAVEETETNTEGDIRISHENVEKPFDNLLDFTLHAEDSGANKCPPLFMDQVNVVPQERNVKDKADNGNGKSQGFFKRFIRRNSKDRKSISQSQENLLCSASSEPSIKEGMAILMESSSSEESSRSQSQEVLVLDPKDRNRSSSFPNRSNYRTMSESESSSSTGISVLSQESDLGGTFSLTSSGTVSTHASSNDEHLDRAGECVLSDSEKCEATVADNNAGNYESKSYFYVELEDNHKMDKNDESDDVKEQKDELESDEKQKNSSDRDCENIVKNKDKHDKKDDSDSNSETDSQKFLSDQGGGKVFTVLNVQGGNIDCMNSCKTDDEKLLELWHSTHSLNSSKSDRDNIADLKSKLTLPLEELSPDQKANAIARHISSLPPFVPPKMKSYPMKLSPVLEKASPVQRNGDSENNERTGSETVESPLSSPALMKQQAKATLRITPPAEDENGKIWFPRTEETQRGNYSNNIIGYSVMI